LSFLPGVCRKAAKEMVATVRQWQIHALSDKDLGDLSRMFDRVVRGWVNSDGRFYKSALYPSFTCLNRRLVRRAQKKYHRYRHQRRATHWLRGLARRQPGLFAHWQLGAYP
jgi:RNA-directed DNA polymerase